MALVVPPLDLPLAGLADFVSQARVDPPGDVGPMLAGQLEIVGPFQSFTADARSIAQGDWSQVETAGWRALARSGASASALIDILIHDGRPSYSLRGAEAAIAFERALEQSAEFEGRPADYEVRWFTLPIIYLTALWLHGESDWFIPTRVGGRDRVEPIVMERPQFEAIARQLVDQATRADAVGGNAPQDVMPDSRSGY